MIEMTMGEYANAIREAAQRLSTTEIEEEIDVLTERCEHLQDTKCVFCRKAERSCNHCILDKACDFYLQKREEYDDVIRLARRVLNDEIKIRQELNVQEAIKL